MQDVWIIIANIGVYYSAVVTTTLVVAYGVFTRWEQTQVGRQFLLTKLCLAVVLDLAAIILTFTNRPVVYTPFTPIRAVVYLLIGTVMLRWLIILVRTQREERRKKHPVWDAPESPPPVRRDQ